MVKTTFIKRHKNFIKNVLLDLKDLKIFGTENKIRVQNLTTVW